MKSKKIITSGEYCYLRRLCFQSQYPYYDFTKFKKEIKRFKREIYYKKKIKGSEKDA